MLLSLKMVLRGPCVHASSSVTATNLQLIPCIIKFRPVWTCIPSQSLWTGEERRVSQVRVPKADPDRFRSVEAGTCQIPRKFERNWIYYWEQIAITSLCPCLSVIQLPTASLQTDVRSCNFAVNRLMTLQNFVRVWKWIATFTITWSTDVMRSAGSVNDKWS